ANRENIWVASDSGHLESERILSSEFVDRHALAAGRRNTSESWHAGSDHSSFRSDFLRQSARLLGSWFGRDLVCLFVHLRRAPAIRSDRRSIRRRRTGNDGAWRLVGSDPERSAAFTEAS